MAERPGMWWMYPMKPTRVTEAILSAIRPEEWTLEKKYDGWRAILIVRAGASELWTRDRKKIEMPGNLELQLQNLGLPEGSVLDGEIWNPAKRGGWKHARGVECQLTFWDIIKIGNEDLSCRTLLERQKVLKDRVRESDCIKTVESLPVTLESVIEARNEAAAIRGTARSGFVHGVVLKRRESPRRDHSTKSHEHPDWMKIVFDGMSGWAPR